MPSVRQPMVQYTPPADPSSAGLSRSNFSRLQAMFPDSPIYKNEIDDDERRARYRDIALSGNVNDNGVAFGGTGVNVDYAAAPNMAEVNISNTAGGANLPTPYYPNPGAPSDVDASTITPVSPNQGYGVGSGHDLSPRSSAQKISGQTMTNLVMGSSTPTSTSST